MVHPAAYIQDELLERGWTLDDLARHSGIPRSELGWINGEAGGPCGVTQSIAKGLARAFGTSSILWVRLQASFSASLLDQLGAR